MQSEAGAVLRTANDVPRSEFDARRSCNDESIQDQYEMVTGIAVNIAAMIANGWNVVVTHGNGPQVGFVLRRSEISISQVPPVPMDHSDADIQGAVGWMFVRALCNEFRRRGMKRRAVARNLVRADVSGHAHLVDHDDWLAPQRTKLLGDDSRRNIQRPSGSHVDDNGGDAIVAIGSARKARNRECGHQKDCKPPVHR